mgnify:CR=1 FL=1
MSTNPSDSVRSGAPMVERLPYEPEAERAVLGAILLDPTSLLMVMEKLQGDEFYLDLTNVGMAIRPDLFDQGAEVFVADGLHVEIPYLRDQLGDDAFRLSPSSRPPNAQDLRRPRVLQAAQRPQPPGQFVQAVCHDIVKREIVEG